MANTCSRTTAIPKYLPKEEVFHTTASRLQQTNITQSALDHVVDVSKETRALVVVARTHDVTHWMDKVHSDWDQYTYLVSEDTNPNDTLHVPANVGNEAMRYLSFLIDRYDSLPDIIAFRHGHENSWHQTFDSAAEVNNLNLTTIRLRRYQNFQCGDSCSQHIYLAETQRNEKRKKLLSTRSDPPVDAAIYEHWNSWFGVPMPEDVAAACCAQFVVTKAARQRYLFLLVTTQPEIAWWNGSKTRQSSVALKTYIHHPSDDSKPRTDRNSSQGRFVSKGFEYLKAKSRTVNTSLSSGESDVAMAASSCERKWYVRGLSMRYTNHQKDSQCAFGEAIGMSHAHNCLLRGLNVIMLRAPHIPSYGSPSHNSSDVRDLLTYIRTCVKTVDHPHHVEETVMFPKIEAMAGDEGEGLFSGALHQYREFHDGLDELLRVAKSLQADPSKSSRTTIKATIDNFAPALVAYLRDEIDLLFLLSLERFDNTALSTW
ncbi:MAG: hypothetical protein ASARMPRED_008287 [Alectoria sarmentosa]|nr:MAG: hypothetical protein ASARMPRED_008287 [Alectoria sarmentosa]